MSSAAQWANRTDLVGRLSDRSYGFDERLLAAHHACDAVGQDLNELGVGYDYVGYGGYRPVREELRITRLETGTARVGNVIDVFAKRIQVTQVTTWEASTQPEHRCPPVILTRSHELVGRAPTPQDPASALSSEPCSKEDLVERHGIGAGDSGRNQLGSSDAAFDGAEGKRFQDLVADVSTRVGLDPGFLAVNALAEHGRDIFLRPGPVQSHEVGLDFWETSRGDVRAHIPAARGLRDEGIGEDFWNEPGMNPDGTVRPSRNTGQIFEFATARDALLAVAAHIKNLERRHLAPHDNYARLSTPVRFALLRYAYNYSPGGAEAAVQRPGVEDRFLLTTGAINTHHPQRVATVRSAQAIHLSQALFHRTLSCGSASTQVFGD